MATRKTAGRTRIIRLEPEAIPSGFEDLLTAKGFANAATIGPDGAPQCNPVWYDWDGEHVCFSQTTGRQKYHNLKREPRLAMSILDPENPYRYLEIRGIVTGIEPDRDNAFIDSLAGKYLGRDTYPWHQPGDERVIVRVAPLRFTTMG